MKLAYVTSYDATDRRSWSGTGHHIAKALEAQSISLNYVGPLRDEVSPLAALKRVFYRLGGKIYLKDRDMGLVAGYSRQVEAALRQLAPEVVFSPGTLPIAKLESERPIVAWTDATFAGLIETYPAYRDLCAETIRAGNALEAEALARCSLIIYSSEWAAESAVRHYGIDRRKVRVVSFGANVTGDRTLSDIRTMLRARSGSRCRLLFMGVDWYRKGGDVALEVARHLNELGIETGLTIVGCQPPQGVQIPNYVQVEGHISKSSQEGRERIEHLLSEAHFLLLPTRADCTPIVFAEANSFGVPCVAPDVGGVASMIREGHNGFVLPAQATPAEYATCIAKIWQLEGGYEPLAISSFEEFRTRLNWQSAGKVVRSLLEEVVRA